MKSIVLATCNRLPGLQRGDELLATELAARGACVSHAPWNGPFAPFEDVDLIVVRSTWDYAAQPAAFADWLDRIGKGRAHIVNSPALMRWNMDKTYLLDLAAKGATFAGEIPDRGFGRGVPLEVPGADPILLYEARHTTAYER